MNISNREFLQLNRDAYIETIQAGTAKKASVIKNDLLRILREEWFPNYVYNEDCGPCIFDLVRIVFRQFNEYEEKKAKETPAPTTEAFVTKASFPSHKNHHRK